MKLSRHGPEANVYPAVWRCSCREVVWDGYLGVTDDHDPTSLRARHHGAGGYTVLIRAALTRVPRVRMCRRMQINGRQDQRYKTC